jgi:hypothetical protein
LIVNVGPENAGKRRQDDLLDDAQSCMDGREHGRHLSLPFIRGTRGAGRSGGHQETGWAHQENIKICRIGSFAVVATPAGRWDITAMGKRDRRAIAKRLSSRRPAVDRAATVPQIAPRAVPQAARPAQAQVPNLTPVPSRSTAASAFAPADVG